MKKIFFILFILILHYDAIFSQTSSINRQQFFLDDRTIEVTFTTDIRKLKNQKKTPEWQPANIIMHFSDTLEINEDIAVEPRGRYRKANCDIASLLLNFKNSSSPKLSPLKKLKLVGGCRTGASGGLYEELLLKEYLIYKIYNFITPMSFRARLMHVTYKDSREKVKSYSQYAFLLEDFKDMADRNNCVEIKGKDFFTESTNRQQMTMVALFQYMIGNTDWSVPKYHNVKLMSPKNDTTAKPFTIPYDFDYAGLVNAPYAVPNEDLDIKSVRDRLYRGYPRNMDELEIALDIFRERKEAIMFYINNFSLLGRKSIKDIANYLEEFYSAINDKRTVKSLFISNARTN